MTLPALLTALGWKHGYAGRRIGVSQSKMWYWCAGTTRRGHVDPPPPWMLDYFRRCLEAVEGVMVGRPEK